MTEPLDSVIRRMLHEDRRVRAQLPAAPDGWVWVGDIQTVEEPPSIRIVYRLQDLAFAEARA